ncbi:MAG: hypothetical protein HY676_04345 [Chloroflexi bacterium]|nr:hypothetical protein [Chloroflexota bacterium]
MEKSASVGIYTDEEISVQLLAIVRAAQEYIVLVTPYIGLWKHVEDALELALKRGIKITVILRVPDDKLKDKAIKSINWLVSKGIELRIVKRLHAKIYYNENSILVTSMNLDESSAKNSKEIAFLIQNGQPEHPVRKYVDEHLWPLSELVVALSDPSVQTAQTSSSAVSGVCIRCGQPISLNPNKPLCENCFDSWNEYGNEDYQEKYCHFCGRSSDVSYAKPLCNACFQRLQ